MENFSGVVMVFICALWSDFKKDYLTIIITAFL